MSGEKVAIKKRGNRLGFWFFGASLRLFGLSGAYGLLYFVCLYYLIFDRVAFSSCMAYVKRRFKGAGPLRRILCVYRIFINQGKNLIDRYATISGLRSFDVEIYGYDKLNTLLDETQKGVVLVTAHVGNWQIAMTALERFRRTVYLLMRPEDNIAVKSTLNIDNEDSRIRIIAPEQFLDGVVEMMKAISEGNIVSIMGDRSYGDNSVESTLFGDKVSLPYAAFAIAAAAQCPAVVLLSSKIATTKYLVDVSHMIVPPAGSRGKKHERITGCVQEFASILEGYAERHPFQWFVYSDLWNINKSAAEK
jgi:predicted LPLAT superfamily acyltransferase